MLYKNEPSLETVKDCVVAVCLINIIPCIAFAFIVMKKKLELIMFQWESTNYIYAGFLSIKYFVSSFHQHC